MAWTTPKTDWSTGNLVAASDLNAIGDNLSALKDSPAAQYIRTATDYTTTSTTLVDVDATNMALTITTTGGDVLVTFIADVAPSNANRTIVFAVDIDATVYEITSVFLATTGQGGNPSFSYIFSGLSAGSHTFKLQWKVVTATTATINAGTALFDVREITGAVA